MRKAEVEIGRYYRVKVSGQVVPVVLTRYYHTFSGWYGRNLFTGRNIKIRSAARLRSEISKDHAEKWADLHERGKYLL